MYKNSRREAMSAQTWLCTLQDMLWPLKGPFMSVIKSIYIFSKSYNRVLDHQNRKRNMAVTHPWLSLLQYMFYDMVQITSHFLWGFHVWRREAHMEAWADGVPPSSATLTSFCCCHWRTLCVRACARNRPVFVWRAPKARFHGNISGGGVADP